ncbi:uncharacterized protein CIMG_05599 [Coccidioides immitis RS]|uniref:CsbD-like domain-containing protein n=3 Tax=Coccidioides immitis TaxID=5501 RepID=J3KFX9_COCIM|nr:uncharacterized protein CIMG_05599 [Coccidioides immitis RS]EAS34575.3 hypothetical protein CIMG_05599 [Coccidioides immitis RS]KMU74473.1 hypothetical protein CISG_04544 [Coccidioides immitis RMSCC 3703]KMU86974.1 hypothetical protein CIHG_04914 [Coccidioides immitis H538.4]TPX21994.1 Chitin synthase, class 1 [Coccidioides immitis]
MAAQREYGDSKIPPSKPSLSTTDPTGTRLTTGGDALNVHGTHASAGATSSLSTDPSAPSTTSTGTMSETTRMAGSGQAGEGVGGIQRSEGGRAAGSSTGPMGAAPPMSAGSHGERTAAMPEREGGVKGFMAGVHGAGEQIRGKAGEVVDRMAHDEEGIAKDREIQMQGREEMETGRFSQATKEREWGNQETGRKKV